MVDQVVAEGRVHLSCTLPVVSCGSPHLRVVQCWKCIKYGHTQARCELSVSNVEGAGRILTGLDVPSNLSALIAVANIGRGAPHA